MNNTAMGDNNTTRRDRQASLHRRIMRRVIPFIIIGMAFAAILTAVLLQSQAREDINESVEQSLEELTLQVNEAFAVPVAGLRLLTNNVTLSSLAQPVVDSNDDITQSAINTLRNLMDRNQNDFISLKFITLDGEQRAILDRNNIGLSVDTTPQASDLADDPIFITISAGISPGTVYLGPLSAVTEEYPAGTFTLYVPVANPNNRNNSIGIVALEVNAERLLQVIDEVSNSALLSTDGRGVLLLNGDNRVLLSVGDQDALNVPIEDFMADNSGEFTQRFIDFRYFASAGTTAQYIGIDTPWQIVMVDDIFALTGETNIQIIIAIILYVFLTVIIIGVLNALLNNVLSPMKDVARVVGGLSENHATAPLATTSYGNDEVGQIVQSVETLSRRLQTLDREKHETQARNQRYMDIIAHIGREISAEYDMERLVPYALKRIANEFDFLHERVFRVDDLKLNAVHVYTHTAIMNPIDEPEKVPIGSNHPVGRVTRNGQPIFVGNIQQTDESDIQNGMTTRMILPLQVGETIIGALDLQTNQQATIDRDDIPAFMVLANQLASAIQNALTIGETQLRIAQLNERERELTRSAWSVDENSEISGEYHYNLVSVKHTPNDNNNGHGNSKNKNALTSPITVRGQTVANLVAKPDEGQDFTQGDMMIVRAVADRVALAIENARLFQETQSSLSETSIMYELSRLLNEASTFEDIVRALITSVMPDATSGQVWIFDDYITEPVWATIQTDVALSQRIENNEDLSDTRVHMPDHDFFTKMHSNQIGLVQDVDNDKRLDSDLRVLCQRVNAQAVVYIPFNVRGLWRGLIQIGFPDVRRFNEREGRIYTSLIDQAGVAIDNRLLLRQTEDALSLQENLYAASRIINQAQSEQDLVYAAVATAENPDLNFALGLLEGDLAKNGWSSRSRIIARSENGVVVEADIIHRISVTRASPMQKREPEIIVDETPNNPSVSPDILWMRELGFTFTAMFPLYSANQPIAIFYVHGQNLTELTQNDYEIYRAMTGQMSTQIEIRRQVERTEQALDETRRLYLASSAIVSAQDTEEVYAIAVQHLVRPFMQRDATTDDVVGLRILLASPEPSPFAPYLENVYAWRSDGQDDTNNIGQMYSAGEYPYGTLTEQTRGLVYIQDLAMDENDTLSDYRELRAELLNAQINCLMLIPITVNMRWFGVIVLESSAPATFGEQYRRFAQASAEQVAIAIDNKRLFEQARVEADRAQTEARRAGALVEAAQLANRIGSGDVEDSLTEVFEQVGAASGFDRWMLMLNDRRTGELTPVISHLPGYDTTDMPIPITTNLPIVEAALKGQTLVINDLNTHTSITESGNLTGEMMAIYFGKHIATPISAGRNILGSLFMGRDLDTENLDERDEQLVTTLAAQVAIALENRRLFQQAQSEQQRLQSILGTLPAGVLVLDPITMKPLMHNEQAERYFGTTIDTETPFSSELYNIYRTGTDHYYPDDEMPVFVALNNDALAFADDVAIIGEDHRVDLQFSAAPIHAADGDISSIVVAFQDISALRNMENTLQDNLRQTVTLYETQLKFSETEALEELLDAILEQLVVFQPDNAFIIQTAPNGELQVERALLDSLHDLDVIAPLFDVDQSIDIQNTATYPMDDAVREALHAQQIRNIITVPIRTRQRATSWLVVASDTPEMIATDEESVLIQISDAAATAIDNRFLIKSQQDTLREINTLYSATTTISRTRDLQQLGVVLEGALATLSPDYMAGYLFEEMGFEREELDLFQFNTDQVDPIPFSTVLSSQQLPSDGLFITDVHALTDPTPLEQLLIDLGNVRGVGLINLRVQDGAGGTLIIAFSSQHDFTEGEQRYLNTVVDSASVVVDNMQLFEQTQSTLEETTVLYQASRALTDAEGAEDIVDVVVNYLIGPHITQVFIAMLSTRTWDSPTATVEIGADWSDDPDASLHLNGLTLSREQFPAWNLLSSTEVISVDDIEHDDRLDAMERIGIQSLDVRSVVVIPLRVASRAIGAVWLASNEPYHHNTRDLRLYQAFAEQASLSMEAAYLLAQTDRRARQLQTSAQVSQSAGNILDLEILLSRLVELIQESFGYDHVQIFLMDEEHDWALLRASTGEAGQKLLSIDHKLQKGSDSIIGQVTAKAEPAIALDTADAGVVHKPNPYLPLTRSEMALPIMLKNEVVGALDVQSNLPNAFNEEDISALTTLAAQIAVALDNANLYKASQEQAERMGFLFNVTQGAAAAPSLEDTLETIVRRLYDELNVLSTTIYLRRVYVDERTDKQHSTMRAAVSAGSDHPIEDLPEIRFDDETHIFSDIVHANQPLQLGDLTEEDRYTLAAQNARSALIVPLRSGGEIIGVVTLESVRVNGFGDDEIRLLEALAGSTSAVIQSTQLLEQLTKTNEQLRELDRVKSDFLANMSHELRTPLNSIIGFSRVMMKGIDGPLTEMQEQDLTTIYNSGQHLLMLINDILDQAKIAAGKLDIKLEYFDIKLMIEAVRSIGIGLVKDKPVNLMLEIAPNMPKAFGDEFRLRQVMINLVSNAAKFTNEGEIVIRAYLWDDPAIEEKMARIDVVDTGIGIAEKDIPLLFEAFRQVDSSLTRTAGGTGLGLPIAKSLVEIQGGEMMVTSEVNVGSTFSLTIPLEPTVDLDQDDDDYDDDDTMIVAGNEAVDDTKPTIEVKKATQTQMTPPVMPTKRDVLLIEDNKNMVDQFRRILQREGFEVVTADHPSYAEAMVSNLRPTLLVMDVNFASGEGWNILERLKDRDDTFDIPIVVVSLSDESERAYQLGAHTFIQRPFDPETFEKAVLQAEEESSMERILIIDDQPESVRLLTAALNASGTYRVFSAENGREGISMVARRRPDLIVLDLRMPEMDGFAVLQELRGNPETSSIPVMVVTGELDFNTDEKDVLQNVHVLHKTDITQEEYEAFVKSVQDHLTTPGE